MVGNRRRRLALSSQTAVNGISAWREPVWILFDQAIPAALARRLGSHLLTETMESRPDIGLDSYDRLFPSQEIEQNRSQVLAAKRWMDDEQGMERASLGPAEYLVYRMKVSPAEAAALVKAVYALDAEAD